MLRALHCHIYTGYKFVSPDTENMGRKYPTAGTYFPYCTVPSFSEKLKALKNDQDDDRAIRDAKKGVHVPVFSALQLPNGLGF